MLDKKISKALTELNVILNYTENKITNKIPSSFINYIEENCDKDYNFRIEKEVSLSQQNTLEETKYLIALIYRSYLCNEEEKKEYDKILEQNETTYQKGLQEKYDIDVFKNRNENLDKCNLPSEIKEKNIFKRIINKIKEILKI